MICASEVDELAFWLDGQPPFGIATVVALGAKTVSVIGRLLALELLAMCVVLRVVERAVGPGAMPAEMTLGALVLAFAFAALAFTTAVAFAFAFITFASSRQRLGSWVDRTSVVADDLVRPFNLLLALYDVG